MDILSKSTEDYEREIGEQIRQMRIRANLDQKQLASQSNISLGALMNLENGKGSSLKTIIKVLRTLGRDDWFGLLAPRVKISPMQQLKDQNRAAPRRNVFRPRTNQPKES